MAISSSCTHPVCLSNVCSETWALAGLDFHTCFRSGSHCCGIRNLLCFSVKLLQWQLPKLVKSFSLVISSHKSFKLPTDLLTDCGLNGIRTHVYYIHNGFTTSIPDMLEHSIKGSSWWQNQGNEFILFAELVLSRQPKPNFLGPQVIHPSNPPSCSDSSLSLSLSLSYVNFVSGWQSGLESGL